MTKRLGRFARQNTIALLALFLALGGTSFAAATIVLPKNSVGTKQLKNGAVTKKKINKTTLKQLKGNRGPAGPQGAPGPQGAQGAQGLQGVPGDPSTAGRVAAFVGPFVGPPIPANTSTDLGAVSITVPSDAHFVYVVGSATIAGNATSPADFTFWLGETNCATINDSTRGYDELTLNNAQLSIAPQGRFAAATGAHNYHLCVYSDTAVSSFVVHLTAITEALNATGGTTAPATAPAHDGTRARVAG